jgi:hypothetical protein
MPDSKYKPPYTKELGSDESFLNRLAEEVRKDLKETRMIAMIP